MPLGPLHRAPHTWQLASLRVSDPTERDGQTQTHRECGRWGRKGQKEESGEKCTKDRSHRVFYKIILEMTSYPFCHILLVIKSNSGTLWEGTKQGCDYQEVGIIVSYLGSCQAPYFTQRKRKNLYLEVHNKALVLDLFIHL